MRYLGFKPPPGQVFKPVETNIPLELKKESPFIFQNSYSSPELKIRPEKTSLKISYHKAILPRFPAQQQPRIKYLVSRSFSTSFVSRSSKSGSSQSSKCKAVKDLCKDDKAKGGCSERKCLKPKSSLCNEQKPKCPPIAKKLTKEMKRPKSCHRDCLPKRKIMKLADRAPEKQEYPPSVCPPSKVMKTNPCPCPSKEACDADPQSGCPPLPSLPKPPSQPIILCPCPPPPKLPPTSCPCMDDSQNIKKKEVPTPPCAPKVKHTCSNRVYYCPPDDKSKKKNKTKRKKKG